MGSVFNESARAYGVDGGVGGMSRWAAVARSGVCNSTAITWLDRLRRIGSDAL